MLSIGARGGLVLCHQERDIATMMTQQPKEKEAHGGED